MHGAPRMNHLQQLRKRQDIASSISFASIDSIIEAPVASDSSSMEVPIASTSALPSEVPLLSTSTLFVTSTSTTTLAPEPESTTLAVAATNGINIKAVSLESGVRPTATVDAQDLLSAISLLATPTAAASSGSAAGVVANPGILSAAVAWVSFNAASSASHAASASSASSFSRFLAGPSGSSVRASLSSASSASAAASASTASARSIVEQRASFLAAVGSGVALAPEVTQVFDPSENNGKFVVPGGGNGEEGTLASAGETQGDFLSSLGKTPTSIALTSLVCVAISAVVIAAVAFFLRRWCVRRKRRATRYNMFRDEDDEAMARSRGDDSGSRYEDDRWSAKSIIRRHSAAEADAVMIEGDFRGPTEMMRSVTGPVLADYQLPRTPPRAITVMRRTLSNGSVGSDGYAAGQSMGVANPSPDSPTTGVAPLLPYISWQPPLSLPVGAAGGMTSADVTPQPVDPSASRFSSFSTVLPISRSPQADPFATPRLGRHPIADSEVNRTATGHSMWSSSSAANDADDDAYETETLGEEDSDYEADRVSVFRRTLSLAGSMKTDIVSDALKARRASAISGDVGHAV